MTRRHWRGRRREGGRPEGAAGGTDPPREPGQPGRPRPDGARNARPRPAPSPRERQGEGPSEGGPGGGYEGRYEEPDSLAAPLGGTAVEPSPELPAERAPLAQPIAEETGEAAPIQLAPSLPPVPPRDPDGDDVFAELAEAPSPQGRLVALAGVKLRDTGRVYECDAGDLPLARGDRVLVDTDRGPQLGAVAVAPIRRVVQAGPDASPPRRVLRKALAEDLELVGRAATREREAATACRDLLRARKLPLKLVRVEMPAPGRAFVYVSSEERVELHGLVRDFSTALRVRVELRHLGPRDEAKVVGGIGSCGRELCCSTFLPKFEPVSIRMAKDQGLALNPSKLAGQCGRLKCCLVYEEAVYAEQRKTLPKIGKRVQTQAGDGKVVDVDVLRRRVRVSLVDGTSQTFAAADVTVVAAPQQQPQSKPTPPAPKQTPPTSQTPPVPQTPPPAAEGGS